MNVVLPTPAAVVEFLDRAAGELDTLGKELEAAHIDLGDAEVAYEEALDEALLALADEYEELGKRLPGEDLRLAKARKRIDFTLYSTYRKAKRRVEGLNLHSRKVETAVSARQSTLRIMREEGNLHSSGFTGGNGGPAF